MLIVLIGAPGSGKGTQSTRLSKQFEIPHLSTGVILRQVKSSGTELGKALAPILDSGSLVRDDLMLEIVRQRITESDCENGCLLDGFPRTIPQAEGFEQMLEDEPFATQGRSIAAAIELCVEETELVRRLTNRYSELDQPRPEDAPEAIPKRIQIYHEETEPLVEFYRQRKCLVSVDGSGSEDDVFQRLMSGIRTLV